MLKNSLESKNVIKYKNIKIKQHQCCQEGQSVSAGSVWLDCLPLQFEPPGGDIRGLSASHIQLCQICSLPRFVWLISLTSELFVDLYCRLLLFRWATHQCSFHQFSRLRPDQPGPGQPGAVSPGVPLPRDPPLPHWCHHLTTRLSLDIYSLDNRLKIENKQRWQVRNTICLYVFISKYPKHMGTYGMRV